MRLEEQQFGGHEQQIIVAETARHALTAVLGVEIELEPFQHLIERTLGAKVEGSNERIVDEREFTQKLVLTWSWTAAIAPFARTPSSAILSVSNKVAGSLPSAGFHSLPIAGIAPRIRDRRERRPARSSRSASRSGLR